MSGTETSWLDIAHGIIIISLCTAGWPHCRCLMGKVPGCASFQMVPVNYLSQCLLVQIKTVPSLKSADRWVPVPQDCLIYYYSFDLRAPMCHPYIQTCFILPVL